MTPEVIREARISLHVFRERSSKHHLPHCHVRRHDGAAETVVALPSLDVIVGKALSRQERETLEANVQDLMDEWERTNA